MKKTMTANRITGKRRGNSGHGFTLVEFIVVIVIIAVLAAVGLATALGYIKKSRFEQNSQSAVSVYQAAQTALSMKVANGTNDSWTKKLVEMKLKDDQITALTKDLDTDNESTSVVLALTYNPKSASANEDSYLYNLLTDQFYDKTIFNGTIAVEFNVVASYAKGRIYYSSWVASAFYCSQNDADTKWSDVCIGNSNDGLPQREPYEYRRDTSLVGWYNGTPDSVTGPDGVCPVHIPKTVVNDLDGHIIADSTDTGYLFNLRNAETLDVSWAIFDYDDTPRSIDDLAVHDEDITINLITEGTSCGNSESYDTVELYINQSNLQKFRNAAKTSTETITYENINSKTNIERHTWAATVDVQVTRGLTTDTWKFPMTITLVTGDDRMGCPDASIGYYEYRLALDCMMNRQSETEAVTSRFNAERLFGTTPRNISATLTATFTHYLAKDQTESRAVNDVLAARAIDDPVYYTGLSSVQGKTSYCYMVVEEAAKYDGDDDNEEKITGKCVVNTLFGDLKYSDSLAATSWSGSGNSAVGNAVITSFRHLYNIRWIQAGTVKYTIVRDLNWYINNPGTLLVSEVKVFKKNGEYCSPSFTISDTATSNKLHIVSFPALKELKAGQTLTSASSGGKTFSINNLQMRTASFRNNQDSGYGLICMNNGTVSNIYTNNFNLILAPVADGSDSDYGSVSTGEVEISTYSYSSLNNSNYVGGLVGLNHGNVGSADASSDANIIMMSNAIIMSCSQTGNYWGSGTYPGVSGIIGKNDGTLAGTLEINGRFAVMGNGNVGAAIAYTNTDVGARIVVDGVEHGRSEFTLPVETTTGSDKNLSCVIAGTNNVGGAIGFMESCGLTYTVNKMTDDNVSYNSDTGEVAFDGWSATDYQIYVNLPEDALIVELYNGASSGNGITSGGAIGNMLNCSGDYMSIRVKNLGNMLVRNKDWNWNEVGGAIGRDNNSSIATTYIFVYNGDGALGSRLDDSNSPLNNVEHGGGVYGLLETTNGRKFYLDVVNDGTKISAISNKDGDNQGAGGAIGSLRNGNATIVANVVNKSDSKFVYYSDVYSGKNNGVGGAIGTIQNNDSVYLTDDSHIYVENNGYIHANYNVGGAIGVMSINHGDIYAFNDDAEITGNYCVGGAVGWGKKAEDGKIQSILSGTTISGNEFVGGAAGRIPNLQGGTISTKVYGTSKVLGVGSIVGGVCGDVRVQGDGTGSLILDGNGSKLTVSTSKDGVGGVAGLLRANMENKVHVEADGVILNVKGAVAVGGAIGKLRSTSWEDSDNANANTTTALTGQNKTKNDINVYIDVVLPHPSTIEGTDNVGGAIGFVHCLDNGIFGGYVSVRTESGSSDDSAIIRGRSNVGGAIGHFGSCYPDWINENSKIVVDFTDSPITIESTVASNSNANLGGAVGYFDSSSSLGNENCEYSIVANLGGSSLLANGSNVGGAIGYNTIKNGIIIASLSGTIEGNNYVAGGIGNNRSQVKSVAFSGTEAEIIGNGDYVGGAIGFNNTVINMVAAEFDHESTISGNDYVGGALGFNNNVINTVAAEFDHESSVSGNDYVGGAIGLDENNISSVSAELDESSTVSGRYYVGGTIGRVSNKNANLESVSVVIDSGSYISGIKYLGGAVGSLGTGSNSATIGTVSAEINTGIPIVQTEDVSKSEEACIGGVIGVFVRGTINQIELSGSGGDINPQIDVQGCGAPYYSLTNGVLVSGSGKCIGGIVGLLGDSTAERDVKIIDISVPDDGPSLAVVSSNGSQGIGGWIGTCYSKAILGDSKTSLSCWSVQTVKVVYSRGECVGGFIGYVGKTPTNVANRVELYINLEMSLSSAYVCGLARTGGVYGDSNCAAHYGTCNLNICDNTSIGDYKGDIETDDITGCFCIEAGGFAGRFSNRSVFNGNPKVDVNGNGTIDKDEVFNEIICEITITIDESSRIFAGGTSAPSDCEVSLGDAGVGGAVGRLGGSGGKNNEISVNNTTAENITDHYVKAIGVIASSSKPVVYSAYSHAGGAIGHMISNCLGRSFTTACVKQVGPGCTGGFVGKMDEGSLRNCYSGGHTFGGQYVPDEENVVGTQYVGGFAGYVGKSISNIYQSYSTSSVRSTYTDGPEVYLGGFIGGTDSQIGNDKLQFTYCTGLVTAPNSVLVNGYVPNDGSVYVGAYAGYLTSVNVCKSGKECGRVLMYINEYSEIGRVGNISEDLFDDGTLIPSTNPNKEDGIGGTRNAYSNRVLLARWGSWGTNWYIRHNKDSKYIAQPFDTYLEENSDNYFPLRTFISYKMTSNSWKGEHWGDWPVFPEDKIQLNKDNTTINLSLPADGIVFNGIKVTIDEFIEVKYDGQTLEKDKDYALKYSDNDKVGTATVRITAIGDYYGSFARQFTIKQADISNPSIFTVTVTNATPYLEGVEVKPPVTIVYKYSDKETTLVENKDYTLLYENNIEPGEAKVTITGIGNYTGVVEKNFTILPLYDIFFSTGDGTAIPQQRIFEGGLAVKPKDDPICTGHTFGGWYADAECETEYDFSTPVMDNVTIYAKWIAEKYEVSFEVNGGSPAIDSMPVEYGNTISSESVPELIQEGYTFMGWYTDALCAEEYDFDSVVTSAFTLYARWEKTPTVSFDTNGGSSIDSVMIERYNGCVSKPEDPTLEGYTFLAWCSDEECNNEFNFDTQLTADITLYAKWGKNPTVTFYINDDNIVPVTIPYGAKASSVVPEIPEWDGWTPIPDKWFTDLGANIIFDMDSEVTEDVTLYLGWLKTWKVTLHTGDGATVYGDNGVLVVVQGVRLSNVLDPVEPVREGYIFKGWYTDPNCINPYSSEYLGVIWDIDLYAKWEEDPEAT